MKTYKRWRGEGGSGVKVRNTPSLHYLCIPPFKTLFFTSLFSKLLLLLRLPPLALSSSTPLGAKAAFHLIPPPLFKREREKDFFLSSFEGG